MIFFVVLGHIAERYTNQSDSMRLVYLWIYTFHMPVFIFISGLCGKKNIDQNRYHHIFTYLVLTYFIKVLMMLTRIITERKFYFSLFRMDATTWYAFALFVFSLSMVFLKRYDRKWTLCVLIIMGLMIGYDESISDQFALSRIIVYFPFFYMGYCADSDKLIEMSKKKGIVLGAATILIVMTIFVYKNIESIYWFRPLLTGRNPYIKLGDYMKYGAILRLLYYIVVSILVLSVVIVVPNVNCFLSKLGKRTLQVYVLHYSVILILVHKVNVLQYMQRWYPEHPYVFTIPLAIAIMLVCSLPIFDKLFSWILTPKIVANEIN